MFEADDLKAAKNQGARLSQNQEQNIADRRKERFRVALEMRKFEHDLYWKRAAFGWGFMVLIFGGYLGLKTTDFVSNYAMACLGFVLSVAWYCINRASAAWMRNWEFHVDLLEDQAIGPLFKTIMNPKGYNFYNLINPFPFSPQRILNIVAMTVSVMWFFILVKLAYAASPSVFRGWSGAMLNGVYYPPLSPSFVGLTSLTLVMATWILLFAWAKVDYPVQTSRVLREVQ